MKKFAIFNFGFLILAAIAAAAYFGYRAGEKSVEAKNSSTDAAALVEKSAPTPLNENSEKEKSVRLTPEQLAKDKGVAAVLTNPDGEYTLMSVIEGTEVNQRLTENLQLVVLQRQQLASLAKQFDEAPVSAVQQRELIAGQINEVRNALNGNQQFMAQNYGYTFDKSYLRVPHKVSLVSVEEIEGKTKTEIVHEFQTSEAFAEFQKKNDDYTRSKMEITKAAEKTPAANTPDAAAAPAEPLPDAKVQAEIAQKRDDLMKAYRFDPERQYSLQYHKTAFYAKSN